MVFAIDTASATVFVSLYFLATVAVTGYLHLYFSTERLATGPWFLANLLLMATALTNFVRFSTDLAPVPLLLLSNGMLLAGYVLHLVGLARLLGKRLGLMFPMAVIVGAEVLLFLFSAVWNDLASRSSVFAFAMLSLQGLAFTLYWQTRRHELASSLLPSLFFHLLGLVILAFWALRIFWDLPSEELRTLGGPAATVFMLLLNFMFFGIQMGEFMVLYRHMALREASRANLLETLLDTIPDLVWMKDSTSTYRVTNRAFQELFGLRAEELHDKTDLYLMDALTASKLRADDQRAMVERQLQRTVDTLPVAAGQYRTFETLKTPLLDAQGEVIGTIGIARDQSDRRSAELDLRRSEDRFRALIEQAPLAVCITRGPKIVYANTRFQQALGLPSSGVVNHPIFRFVAPASRRQVQGFLGSGQMREGHPIEFEALALRSDGHPFPVRVSSSAVRLSEGEATLSFIADLTEAKQSEEQKAKLQAELLQAQRIESLGNLAGGVAHDMNNTLAAILSVATATLAQQEPGAPVHRTLSTIVKAAERGGKMVKSLLGIARQTPLERRPIDVNELLRDEAFLLERVVHGKTNLVLDLDRDLRPVLGDASTLSNALMNLCLNALDAMPEYGTLSLRTRAVGDQVEIQVEDNGKGMPPEVLSRAADLFFTTKEPGKGTGLGLPLVYSTIQAHEGSVALWSEPGKGTRVTLTLPSLEGSGTAVPTTDSVTLEQPQPLRILLIDDDDLVREALQEALELLGSEVLVAESGERALAILPSIPEPQVIILDMSMPGLGGRGTLPLLRERLPSVPVLLSTGQHDQAVAEFAASFPHVLLLPKPYSIQELSEKLKATLA